MRPTNTKVITFKGKLIQVAQFEEQTLFSETLQVYTRVRGSVVG
jgi:hypothetical protein